MPVGYELADTAGEGDASDIFSTFCTIFSSLAVEPTPPKVVLTPLSALV
jgi:hypothetical protein